MNKQILTLLIIGAATLGVFLFSKVINHFGVPVKKQSAVTQKGQAASILSASDKQHTNKVASLFLNYYINYDRSKPLDYLFKVNPLVTSQMYETLLQKHRDIPLDVTVIKLEKTQAIEGAQTATSIDWQINVTETVMSTSHATSKKTSIYKLTVTKQTDDTWKINNMQVTAI